MPFTPHAGLPSPALMHKVLGLTATWLTWETYPFLGRDRGELIEEWEQRGAWRDLGGEAERLWLGCEVNK